MAFVMCRLSIFEMKLMKLLLQTEITVQGSVMDNAEQIGLAVKYVGLRPALPVQWTPFSTCLFRENMKFAVMCLQIIGCEVVKWFWVISLKFMNHNHSCFC